MLRPMLTVALSTMALVACASGEDASPKTTRPELETIRVERAGDQELAPISTSTAEDAGLRDRARLARGAQAQTLEEQGAPAGSDAFVALIRAHHNEGRPNAADVSALSDAAATLLAVEKNAVTMGERTTALRLMELAPDERTRARLLDLIQGDDQHPAVREAAIFGAKGFDVSSDQELRTALEQAAQSANARVKAAAEKVLQR